MHRPVYVKFESFTGGALTPGGTFCVVNKLGDEDGERRARAALGAAAPGPSAVTSRARNYSIEPKARDCARRSPSAARRPKPTSVTSFLVRGRQLASALITSRSAERFLIAIKPPSEVRARHRASS